MTVSIDLSALLARTLQDAERALDSGDTDFAEYCLNAAARKCRELGVPNTSARYRTLAAGAARQRLGEPWQEPSS